MLKSDRQLLRAGKISMLVVAGKEAERGHGGTGKRAAVRLNDDHVSSGKDWPRAAEKELIEISSAGSSSGVDLWVPGTIH